MRFFEDIEIGAQREFGSFTFTAEDIKKFATQFDPQRFHLDEEEGRKSLFGGLAASGWHVAAVCMKLLVADGKRLTAEAVARDGSEFSTVVRLGQVETLKESGSRALGLRVFMGQRAANTYTSDFSREGQQIFVDYGFRSMHPEAREPPGRAGGVAKSGGKLMDG